MATFTSVDRLNYVIRQVDAATGVITTVAGTGEAGYGGDGGPGTQAMFREPNDCFLDGRGGLLIADIQDQRVAPSGPWLRASSPPLRAMEKRPGAGTAAWPSEASILGARAVCLDSRGNAYIAEREGNGVRKVDANGVMSTFAGTGERGYDGDGGPALAATWGAPKAIRCDGRDNVIVVDTENHAIRRIDPATGVVVTIAGGRLGGQGDGGPAMSAGLDRPPRLRPGPAREHIHRRQQQPPGKGGGGVGNAAGADGLDSGLNLLRGTGQTWIPHRKFKPGIIAQFLQAGCQALRRYSWLSALPNHTTPLWAP